MDSIRVSEAPDPGSIPGEATTNTLYKHKAAQNTVPVRLLLFSEKKIVHIKAFLRSPFR